MSTSAVIKAIRGATGTAAVSLNFEEIVLCPDPKSWGGPSSVVPLAAGRAKFQGSTQYPAGVTFKLSVVASCSLSGMTGAVQLYDITAGAFITGATLTFTSTSTTSAASATLALPSTAAILEAQMVVTAPTPPTVNQILTVAAVEIIASW